MRFLSGPAGGRSRRLTSCGSWPSTRRPTRAGAVVLRREGLFSSLLVEWRRSRDAGALAGLSATRGRPPADPIERDNTRLRQSNAQLEQNLATAREVIAIQGKLSALFDDLSKRAHDASTPLPSGPGSTPRSS